MNEEIKTLEIDHRILKYREIILKGGTKQINREIALENLKLFCSLIEKAKLCYGLFFGTLLGALRENYFIEHDQDTDVFMLYEQKEDFLKLLFGFDDLELKLIRICDDLVSLMRKGEYIDIYFFKVKYKFGIQKLRVFNNEYEYPAHYLENQETFYFRNIKTFIPRHSFKIIRNLYGKNWKIPDKNYKASPNTMYKRISNLTAKYNETRIYRKFVVFTKFVFHHLGL